MSSLQDKKVVIIGGGTGQSRAIKALKNDIDNLSAVVAMADDGGSTGRLRRYHNAPAVGDLRNCMCAFADPKKLWSKIFPHRFGNDRWATEDIKGHTVGNIVLVALIDTLGGLRQAIATASKELGIKPTQGVYPSTFENVTLRAQLGDGSEIIGQYNISYNVPRAKKFKIKQLFLDRIPPAPGEIKANPDVLRQIKQSDVILIGPGGLHHSILPNLLIPSLSDAVASSRAKTVYIANTAIKLSETRGFSLDDHVNAIIKHTKKGIIDFVLVNNKTLKHERSTQMLMTQKKEVLGIPVIAADLVDEKDIFVHDPKKLRAALLDLIAKTA